MSSSCVRLCCESIQFALKVTTSTRTYTKTLGVTLLRYTSLVEVNCMQEPIVSLHLYAFYSHKMWQVIDSIQVLRPDVRENSKNDRLGILKFQIINCSFISAMTDGPRKMMLSVLMIKKRKCSNYTHSFSTI